MNDFGDEDSASSGGLVVRVREVVPGSLELTLTIGDANGDYPEVSRANTMRDANHPVPEEMSSDTPVDLLAGSHFGDGGIDRDNGRPAAIDESGDVHEVRTDSKPVTNHGVDEGQPSDAPNDVCAGGATSLEPVVARVATSLDDFPHDHAASRHVISYSADDARVEDDETICATVYDAPQVAHLDVQLDCRGSGPEPATQMADDGGHVGGGTRDELTVIAGATVETIGRLGALDPVRIRAGERSVRSLTAHARFLQYVFRRSQRRAELESGARSAWTRGGMSRYFPMLRPVHAYRCHASGVAGDADFVELATRSREVLSWYACYVRVLGRLDEKTPAVLSGYCGAGGTDEGVRRAGAVSHGIDMAAQPEFCARFGEEHFTQGDARDERVWSAAEKLCRPFLRASSPPCQPFSTGRLGEPTQPALIAETRGLLERRGTLWWMENVLGAVHEMSCNSTVLRGAWFGLHVDRGRRFETNFPVHVDDALSEGERLRARTCLGGRRRWLRLDPFGRPVRSACCGGNLFAVQGGNPTRSSVAENAHAMGIDASHMRWTGLAQAIPPAYAELLVGQAAMYECWTKYGVPMMTYDDYTADPRGCARRMSAWLRGAGEAASHAGLELVGPAATPSTDGVSSGDVDRVAVEASSSGGAEISPAQPEARGWGEDDWALCEAEFRTLFYARGGDAVRCLTHDAAPRWLDRLVASPRREVIREARGEGGVFIHLSESALDASFQDILKAARAGQRITLLTPDGNEAAAARGRQLRAAGFVSRRVWAIGTEVRIGPEGTRRGVLTAGARAWSCGRRRARPLPISFDFERARAAMDPIDAGLEPKEQAEKKLERAWEPVPWNPDLWRGKGLRPEVERLMTEGADVLGPDSPGFYEIPQYPFGS